MKIILRSSARHVFFWIFASLGVFGSSLAQADLDSDLDTSSPRFLVHILDYLAKDYGGAVSNGKVVSELEYKEQIEFIDLAVKAGGEVEVTKTDTTIKSELAKLSFLIHGRASAKDVATLARSLQSSVIQLSGLEVAPQRWPDLHQGKILFQQNCVSCHGLTGAGDGPLGEGLEPKPANFLSDHMVEISPFQAFNTIRLGVPGTGMQAFHTISDFETWSLAFYLISLRHQNSESLAALPKEAFDDALLRKVANSSDALLLNDSSLSQAQVGAKNELDRAALLGSIRSHSSNDSEENTGLHFARSEISRAVQDYADGNSEKARARALNAYLNGVEPVESKLAVVDREAVTKIEVSMAALRVAIEQAKPYSEVYQALQLANADLDVAIEKLKDTHMSAWVVFVTTGAIFLREGFEAVLIIIALLSVIRASGVKRAALWVHGGWLAALGTGALAWLLAGWLLLISGASREFLEGFTSLLAVVVLLVVGFWLHNQTEIGRWTSFIKGRVQQAVQGRNVWVLFSISFIAVFREAFETVLFLRAILLEGGENIQYWMAASVTLSLSAIMLMAWAILRFSARVPIRQLFGFSSIIMGALAMTLTGKGIHSLQEGGYCQITPLAFSLRIEGLGLFPTWESLGAQAGIFAIAFALWTVGRRPSKTLRAASTKSEAPAQ